MVITFKSVVITTCVVLFMAALVSKAKRRHMKSFATRGKTLSQYSTGSLFSDCQGVALPQLVAMSSNRVKWRAIVALLRGQVFFK